MPKPKITPPLARHHGSFTIHLTTEGIELFNLKDCPETAPKIRVVKQKGGKVQVEKGRVYVTEREGIIAFVADEKGTEQSFGLNAKHWTDVTTGANDDTIIYQR